MTMPPCSRTSPPPNFYLGLHFLFFKLFSKFHQRPYAVLDTPSVRPFPLRIFCHSLLPLLTSLKRHRASTPKRDPVSPRDANF
jgi:hypothetical protein